MREAAVEDLLSDRAGRRDSSFVIAQILEHLEAVQRAKMRNLRHALFRQLLLQHLHVAAGLLGVDLQLVQMERGLAAVAAQILQDQCVAAGKAAVEIRGCLTAGLDDLLNTRNLQLQAKALDLGGGEVGGHKGMAVLALDGRDVIEPVLDLFREIRTKEAGALDLGAEVLNGGGQDAAFAEGGDILDLMERERSEMADRSELAALVFTAERVRCVLKHNNIMLSGQLHDGVHVDGIAADVHGHDHLRLVGDLSGHVGRVHVERARVNVGKDDLAADGQRIRHRGSKGDGRNDDLIAGLEAGVFARDFKARGAVGQKCTALGLEVLIAHRLGLGDLFVKRQLCRRLGHLVKRVDLFLHCLQRGVIRLAMTRHHELDDGHQVFRVVVLADRCPGHLGLTGIVSEIRRFLFCFCFVCHSLTPFKSTICSFSACRSEFTDPGSS